MTVEWRNQADIILTKWSSWPQQYSDKQTLLIAALKRTQQHFISAVLLPKKSKFNYEKYHNSKIFPIQLALDKTSLLSLWGRAASGLSDLPPIICFCFCILLTLPFLACQLSSPVVARQWLWFLCYIPGVTMGKGDKKLFLLLFITFKQ